MPFEKLFHATDDVRRVDSANSVYARTHQCTAAEPLSTPNLTQNCHKTNLALVSSYLVDKLEIVLFNNPM
jgi:hypothetical protein